MQRDGDIGNAQKRLVQTRTSMLVHEKVHIRHAEQKALQRRYRQSGIVKLAMIRAGGDQIDALERPENPHGCDLDARKAERSGKRNRRVVFRARPCDARNRRFHKLLLCSAAMNSSIARNSCSCVMT